MVRDIPKTLLALVAVIATAGALWFTNRSVIPKTPSWEDVVAEAESGGYRLISTDALWEQLGKNPHGLLLVDTRQEWEYRTGHIKGAVNFPMEPSWLARFKKKGELKTFLGADKDRSIVFYCAGLT